MIQSPLVKIQIMGGKVCLRCNGKSIAGHCQTKTLLTSSSNVLPIFCLLTSSKLLQWKVKLWAGKFAWAVKAKHCWVLSTNFWKQRVCRITQQCFSLLLQVYFPDNNLNFHWRWRWWDQIQAIFLNLYYFISAKMNCIITCRAKRANTMMQNMVSVMTSASCLTAFSRALMIVFKPRNEKKEK